MSLKFALHVFDIDGQSAVLVDFQKSGCHEGLWRRGPIVNGDFIAGEQEFGFVTVGGGRGGALVEGEGADGGLNGRAVVVSRGDDWLWGGEGGGFPR